METKTEIREHMKVVSSDGRHVGTVDRIEGDRIKLTKSDPAAGGEHHYIDMEMIDCVEADTVCLNTTERETRDLWS